MIIELLSSQLDYKCSLDFLELPSDSVDFSPLDSILCQEDISDSIDFSLAVKGSTSNVFLAGNQDLYSLDFISNRISNLPCNQSPPADWCYIYNFFDTSSPLALSLPHSMGLVLKNLLQSLASDLLTIIPYDLSSFQTISTQKTLLSHFINKQFFIMEKITRISKNYNFFPKNNGFIVDFFPIIDDVILFDEEDINNLSPSIKKTLEHNLLSVHKESSALLSKLQNLYTQLDSDLLDIDLAVASNTISLAMNPIFETFSDSADATVFLNNIKGFLIDNFYTFISEDSQSIQDVMSILDVNVVSSSLNNPLVVGRNVSVNSLLGYVPVDLEGKVSDLDFMNIKGGLFHQANGGFLLLFAKDVFNSQGVFDLLLKVVKNNSIDLSFCYSNLNSITNGINPKPIPLNLKIILLGDSYYYDVFNFYDSDFQKFFPIKIEIDNEMSYTKHNVSLLARAIKSIISHENLKDFDDMAICKIIDYSNRLTQNRSKLSNDLLHITEILKEASTWAELNNCNMVSADYVQKAIDEISKRSKLWQTKLEKLYLDNIFMIDTFGAVVGQINGMCVMDKNGKSFGSPTRITATTCVGQCGIINIEKESNLSGNSHDKGIQIISGWLGQTYAQKHQLSLCCRICFEQNYNGIDGDSASSTELYAIISSLADLPIRQDLAVTGSVNQRGIIQAVGGINFKIEGFFNLCNKRGLKGTEGVIIPASNINDLVLCDEVIDAVENGVFHIYSISNIEEGMELLMEQSINIIHERVSAKLKKFNEFARKC